ncbi:MAG: hypothetical protein JWR01_205 [Subtercola sp.]|nr:hypothetical protein [Subtercola sp.]
MTHLVELTCLEVPFVLRFEGLEASDARRVAESWEWCGGSVVETTSSGRQSVRVVLDPRGRAGAAGPPRVPLAVPDDRPDLVADSLPELEDRLSGLLTRLAIDARRNDLVMLHAGAVADLATGHVIAFVGPSGRGKTTASIALGRVFGYVTDETLGITDDLTVLPYGKPLSVKQPAPERWKTQVSPTALGLRVPARRPLRLVGVVMLDRRPAKPGETLPAVSPLGFAESVGELVPQVSYLAERGRPLQRLRSILESCGGLRQVSYSEADTLAGVFRQLFAEADTESRAEAVGASAVFHPVFDDVVRDGESLVVLNDRVVRVLSGIAPTVFESAFAGSTIEQLTGAVVDSHGLPPTGTADELVAAAIDELVSVGLLRTTGNP